MASISRESNGRKVVQFISQDGKRRSVRLGKVDQRCAERWRLRIEELLNAKIHQQPLARETAIWVGSLDPKMYAKLAAVKLVEPRVHARLGEFVDEFTRQRAADVKASTLQTYHRARAHLVGFFGERKDLRTITAGDAEEWWAWMLGKRKLAKDTARKSVQLAKQFMRAAIGRKVLDADPFSELSGVVGSNPARQRYVTRDDAAKVLAACPDAEWRLLFVLARYGGLRVPSEVIPLRWTDVDWTNGLFYVHGSKTAHHANGGRRRVPIFDDLYPYLLEAFESVEPGSLYVVARYRDAAVNLRTQLHRIIRRAGLEPWPKAWQNLRSTRETELYGEGHPLQDVAAWLGNSPRVAAQHYLQVRPESFSRVNAKARAGAKAVQNPVQQVRASSRTQQHHDAEGNSQSLASASDSYVVPSGAVPCETEKWAIQGSNL